MKKNRIVFIISIIIFLIILIEIVLDINNGIKMSKLNNMYRDISVLENKIALYYLDHGNLPILEENKIEFKDKSINLNDNENFYEIDLSKLENLQLFYGDKKIGIKDVYIINEQSHTVYYYEGCEYKGKKIYTKDIEYEYVDLEKY